MISMEADGSNSQTGAPADGSCSVYHPAGGSVSGCNVTIAAAATVTDSCTTGPIGSVCESDGAIYVGNMGSHRLYAANADESSKREWKTSGTMTDNTYDLNNGIANTNAMITASAAVHPAANACHSKSPTGTWYLPARNELALVWTNRNAIGLSARGFTTLALNTESHYWSSSAQSGHNRNVWIRVLHNGSSPSEYRNTKFMRVRCFRRDP